ncbi:MAG: zinc metallopeptidase [Clostridia bacterium]|nr:zinc metallopeptidase [Clostridia bacterium]
MPFFGYYSFYGVDATVLVLMLAAMAFSLYAQFKVNSTFNKYSTVTSRGGRTAADIARMILDRNGLSHIRVERVSGNLTDHYDPKGNVIRLSDSVYGSTSVAAIGVAAHECGHAVQYGVNYAPIKLRAAIIPATRIGSNLAMPLILLGILMSTAGSVQNNFGITIAYIGVALFSLSTVFQLITLPVEFNASNRALATLEGDSILSDAELKGAGKVLSAAAMTYVAALAVSLVNLLRMIALVNNRRRD